MFFKIIVMIKPQLISIFLLLIVVTISCNQSQTKGEIWNSRIENYRKELQASVVKSKPKSNFRDTVVTIYFENKSSSINPTDFDRLKNINQLWLKDKLWFMKIVGFTDTIGTEKSNDLLSEKRANKVFNLIEKHHKIKREIVYLEWLGESEDVYDLHFQPTHPHQNCVDIWLEIKCDK